VAFLTFEAVAPRAEELAVEAGGAVDAAVGYDPDLGCATFDSDDLDADDLQAAISEALAEIDPDWQSQLRLAD
jgi:hypothetical protein